MHNFNSQIPKELDQWLDDVRESAGFFSIVKPNVWRDIYFENKTDLIKLILQYKDECNIYVSMGTFPDRATGRKKLGVKKKAKKFFFACGACWGHLFMHFLCLPR
jgi:hypothetical protein